MTMLMSFFVTLFSLLPALAFSDQAYSTFTKIQMPSDVTGPESAAFDILGQGPYITVTDGRILKWEPTRGFIDFAYTSPKRTKELCDGTTKLELGPICGRPLALSFNYLTGFLYITDAYLGLLAVGPSGGLATQISTSAEGVPFKFLTGLDVDLLNGTVYFSDASEIFDLRDYTLGNVTTDLTGRFMKYDPWTRQVTVLLRGLNGGGGPAVSSDKSYVLVPEFSAGTINKYWIRGLKENSVERNLLNVEGNVNKIKRGGKVGEFWVATDLIQKTQEGGSTILPTGLRINGVGKVLQTVSFAAQFYNKTISIVQEQRSALYVGSRLTDFLGKYTD